MTPGRMNLAHREKLFDVSILNTTDLKLGFLVRVSPLLRVFQSPTITGVNKFSWAVGPDMTKNWSVALAKLWQQWNPKSYSIEWVSTCTENVNTTQNPKISMCVVYDVMAPVITSHTSLTSVQGYTNTKASNNIVFPINCSSSDRYVKKFAMAEPGPDVITGKPGAVSSFDMRFNVLAFVYILIENYPTNGTLPQNLGEVWINFNNEYTNPIADAIFAQTGGQSADSDGDAFHAYATTAVSTSNYFGTSRVYTEGGMNIVLTATTIAFPPRTAGIFRIEIVWIGDSTAITLPTVVGSLGATTEDYFVNDTYAQSGSTGTTTCCVQLLTYEIVANDTSSPLLTFSVGTLPANITSMDLTIVRLSVQGQLDD